jgi:epoxyqueuosine reductase
LGDPDLSPRRELVNPDLAWLADLENADFERIFNGSPIRRAGFLGMRRNVAIAMGNSGLTRWIPWLQRWSLAESEPESNPGEAGSGVAEPDRAQVTVREAAGWALRRISETKEPRSRGS